MASKKNPLTIQLTCSNCQSSIEIYPSAKASAALCDICQHTMPVYFTKSMESGDIDQCPGCGTYDLYYQKDFNRKLGVLLFILASIASFWTYGLSFIVLYALDFFLFQKLHWVLCCYKCSTLIRNCNNVKQFKPFDHEKNDRIIYNKEQFQKVPIELLTKAHEEVV